MPRKRQDRWALLGELMDRWFPDARGEPGVPSRDLSSAEARLGLAVPLALREWYELCGARSDVWSLQDRLLSPEELRVDGGVLVFLVENQNVVRWGVRSEEMHAEDPPVVVSDPRDRNKWLAENEEASAFALQTALVNAKFSRAVDYSANGPCTDGALRAIRAKYPRLPFPDMHWPPFPTRLYGDDELLIETQADTWLWVTSRSSTRLAEIDSLARRHGVTWEYDSTACPS